MRIILGSEPIIDLIDESILEDITNIALDLIDLCIAQSEGDQKIKSDDFDDWEKGTFKTAEVFKA